MAEAEVSETSPPVPETAPDAAETASTAANATETAPAAAAAEEATGVVTGAAPTPGNTLYSLYCVCTYDWTQDNVLARQITKENGPPMGN